jgi:hypothetical protein
VTRLTVPIASPTDQLLDGLDRADAGAHNQPSRLDFESAASALDPDLVLKVRRVVPNMFGEAVQRLAGRRRNAITMAGRPQRRWLNKVGMETHVTPILVQGSMRGPLGRSVLRPHRACCSGCYGGGMRR